MIGIDSEFCNVESFITGLTDKWPKHLHAKRKTFTLLVCIGMFVLSSSMVTNVSKTANYCIPMQYQYKIYFQKIC